MRAELARWGEGVMAFQKLAEQAKVSGASYPAIKRYLDGDQKPSLEFIEFAARTWGVRPEYLAFGGSRTDEEERRRVALDAYTGDEVVRGEREANARARHREAHLIFQRDLLSALGYEQKPLPSRPQPDSPISDWEEWRSAIGALSIESWVGVLFPVSIRLGVDAGAIGEALAGPLRAIGSERRMSGGALSDYIATMVPVFLHLTTTTNTGSKDAQS